MQKLELDSTMMADDVEEEIRLAPVGCSELYLNCVHLDLEISSAIARLFHSSVSWKSIEMEECTGQVSVLLAMIMAQKVVKLKVVSLSFGRLSEASLFALAVGMRSNTWLKSLTLTLTLTEEDAAIFSSGLTSSSLKRLCMWDCRLDTPATQALAQGIEAAASLKYFGLVACDQCDDRLEILTRALAHHPTLTSLDFRCLASGIAPVADLLRENHNILDLDLSFRSGSEAIHLPTLAAAVQNHPSLLCLHLCGNLLTDDDVETILDCTMSLQTLNLSLNSISDEGISRVASYIATNQKGLQRLFLQTNPFTEVGARALLTAMATNTEIEELCIPNELADIQAQLNYYARLNQGGRRLVLGNCSVPLAMWPMIFERADRLEWDESQWDETLNDVGRAEVVYCLLHGTLFFPV